MPEPYCRILSDKIEEALGHEDGLELLMNFRQDQAFMYSDTVLADIEKTVNIIEQFLGYPASTREKLKAEADDNDGEPIISKDEYFAHLYTAAVIAEIAGPLRIGF